MISRRGAMLSISAAALTGIRPLQVTWTRILQSDATSSQAPQAAKDNEQQTLDDRLRKDTAPHEYSEEGIPVFLACVNLAAKKNTPIKLTPFNVALAAELRKNAAAWMRIKPEAPADDVAKLIEVLATRDFANGGRGTN